jgi:hypothetical protein
VLHILFLSCRQWYDEPMVLMTAWHDDAAGGIRGKVACLSALLGLLTSMSNELLGCWEGGGSWD